MGSLDHGSPPGLASKESDIIDDFTEQALLARLKVSGRPMLSDSYTLQEACDHVRWALDVSRYPTGVPPRRFEWIWGHCLCGCCTFVITVVMLVFMLSFTRDMSGSLNVQQGILVASGSEEPVASTAAVLEQRDLAGLATLSEDVLRNVRDLVVTHRGIWRCLHIARVTKYRDDHVWMEAHDGTAIRLRDGRILLRLGALGDEEPLIPERTENGTSEEGWAPPLAFFDVVRNIS